MISLKRVYEAPSKEDGIRILVERLWPRGLTKEGAKTDLWLKDIAPSTQLRKWFGHDPKKWPEFKEKYWADLDNNKEGLAMLKEQIKKGHVTFVYSAKDTEHNSAVALKEYVLGH